MDPDEIESKERRKLWHSTRGTEQFKQFREGGSALNGVNVQKVKELMENLGLPWDETDPYTVDRMSWLMVMLADHPIEILRFLRDVCGMTETMEEEFNLGNISQRSELGDDNQCVIIDIGTAFCKAGWAGDSMPTCSFPSVNKLGKPVMDRGVISDFEGFEDIIRTCFVKLKTTPSAQTCFIVVAPKTPQHHKEKIAKFLFETLEVPNLFLCTSSYAALCSTDKMSATIVTVGAGICHVVPIYEGVTIQHAIQRMDIAGQDINEFLAKRIFESGSKQTNKRIEEIKKWNCYIPEKFDKENFKLHESPEIIFSPNIIQREVPSLPTLVSNCIGQCDIDTRKALWENIIICGGTSMCKGFIPRFERELKVLCPELLEYKVIASKNRVTTVHQGASNMCFWTEFGDWMISKDEWGIDKEENLSIKCLN